ncbi:response regulator [Actinocatenispora thailandica]|uniref:Response regulator n=2 Tax=Actinocatenispora thailandica TaxID=227318 RepID=A0A7R7HZD5_9ACTN|nr:response regulator [Actinocatenispora thailandica]
MVAGETGSDRPCDGEGNAYMTAPRRARVLMVDDRRENLVALEAILQGMPVDPIAVGSGEEALKRLLSEDFAVILLDAQMPGMDGFETAGHIKQRERTRHVPIIFLTAVDRDAHLAFRGYAAGAVDYITKPFDPWVLRAKVSVFVELWLKNQQLAEQTATAKAREAEQRSLVSIMDRAADVLRGTDGAAVSQALSILGEADEVLDR